MSLNKHQINEYRDLKNSGVDVAKHNIIKPNTGSETAIHLTAKSLVARIGIINNYRVDSEVPIQKELEYYCDVLLWGNDTRLTYAVELQHSPRQEIIDRKVEQYVHGTAIDDLQVLNLNDCPETILDAYGWVGAELGLEPSA